MKEKELLIKPAILILAVCCFLALFFMVDVSTVAAQSLGDDDPSPQPQEVEECLACHGNPDLALTLPSGEVLPTTITDSNYRLSVHGSQGFKCVVCHEGYSGYPHPERTTQTLRDYSFEHAQICRDCHQGQYEQFSDGAHFELLEAGNPNAPVCADCHNPHAEPQFGGSPLEIELAITSQVCAQCHNSIYGQYAQSVHGTALFQQNNPDVPTCVDCHGIHNFEDPTTMQARLKSPQLCANCHTNPAIMGKYGLTTDVLDTYLADFHGTTVTLFERTSPDLPTNKPVCYDCHGFHDIKAVSDPEKGIHIKENLLVTCQRCHPDATINMPDSWLGHYVPSPERNPLVYFVDQFYRFFIPVVLGGMAVFVASDIGKRILRRRKRAGPPSTDGIGVDKEVDHE